MIFDMLMKIKKKLRIEASYFIVDSYFAVSAEAAVRRRRHWQLYYLKVKVANG
jgi:predicted branched-subunit amino acid permease